MEAKPRILEQDERYDRSHYNNGLNFSNGTGRKIYVHHRNGLIFILPPSGRYTGNLDIVIDVTLQHDVGIITTHGNSKELNEAIIAHRNMNTNRRNQPIAALYSINVNAFNEVYYIANMDVAITVEYNGNNEHPGYNPNNEDISLRNSKRLFKLGMISPDPDRKTLTLKDGLTLPVIGVGNLGIKIIDPLTCDRTVYHITLDNVVDPPPRPTMNVNFTEGDLSKRLNEDVDHFMDRFEVAIDDIRKKKIDTYNDIEKGFKDIVYKFNLLNDIKQKELQYNVTRENDTSIETLMLSMAKRLLK